MKNIRHLIALMAVVMTLGTAQAGNLDTQRSKPGKDPWQIMQTILYNHHVDTTGLSVISPIDSVLLVEILPDLKKAYHVDQESPYLNHSTMLGEVICSFMKVKYAGLKGETYDYYKLRYTPRRLYYYYLKKYPDSPYAEEMRLKMECIEQCRAWRNCYTMKDYYEVYTLYDTSYCPYGGFSNIAKRNNALRENFALYADHYSSQNDADKDLESNHDNGINEFLVAPYNKIGYSSLFIGNVGTIMPFTVSIGGPSSVSVVVESGQHEWVELENGEYEIKVTLSNGDEFWPFENKTVTVEDGLYAVCWYDHIFIPWPVIRSSEHECLNPKAVNEMKYILMQSVVEELSAFQQLDYKTRSILMMHYLQKLYYDIEDQEELDELCMEYTDEENITSTIDSIIEVFRSKAAEYKERLDH